MGMGVGKQLGILSGVVVLAWGPAMCAAYALGGVAVAAQSTAAMLICLVPALATLYVGRRAAAASFEAQLAAVLGGSAGRMVGVLGLGAAFYFSVPMLQATGFWLWLGGFYLLTLLLEVWLLAGALAKPTVSAPPSASAGPAD